MCFILFSPIVFVVISQSSSCGSAFQLGGWDVSDSAYFPLEVFWPIAQLVERLVKCLYLMRENSNLGQLPVLPLTALSAAASLKIFMNK